MYIKADSGARTLAIFERRRHVMATPGGKGEGGQRKGKKGGDVHLTVPPGTLVYDDATGTLVRFEARDPNLDPTELAAWTALVSTVMNMDEAITRE